MFCRETLSGQLAWLSQGNLCSWTIENSRSIDSWVLRSKLETKVRIMSFFYHHLKLSRTCSYKAKICLSQDFSWTNLATWSLLQPIETEWASIQDCHGALISSLSPSKFAVVISRSRHKAKVKFKVIGVVFPSTTVAREPGLFLTLKSHTISTRHHDKRVQCSVLLNM